MRPVGEGGEDGDVAEAQAPRGLRAPGSPTEEERTIHERTHLPYRSWCDSCVKGRGQAAPHRSAGTEGRYSEAQISADYWFMGGADEGGSDSLPVLVVYEKTRKVLHAHTVPAKGVQAAVHQATAQHAAVQQQANSGIRQYGMQGAATTQGLAPVPGLGSDGTEDGEVSCELSPGKWKPLSTTEL